jgi:acetylglutamate kinase
MKNKRILIKLGGSVLESKENIQSVCEDIKELKNANIDVIIVHGGGKFITKCLEQIGMTSTFLNGYRVSPKESMTFIQMALYSVNKKLSKTFSSIGINAVGISGEDSNLFNCSFLDKQKYGYVGTISAVNMKVISKLLAQQLTPVVATIGTTQDFESVNINADDVAMKLAIACDADEVIFLTDQDGVYDENKKIFAELSVTKIQELIDTKVAINGMKVKLNSISEILEKSKKSITILSGKKQGLLTKKILLGQTFGTTCIYEENN